MSRRRKQRQAGTFMSLISFMDTIPNLSSTLFFVIIYAALSACGAISEITKPPATPVGTKQVFFVSRTKIVFFPVVDSLMAASDAPWMQTVEDGSVGYQEWGEKFGQAPIGNAVYFLVRSECFEVFHNANHVTLKAGFRMGWGPVDDEVLLR